jgi:hypothetical protein
MAFSFTYSRALAQLQSFENLQNYCHCIEMNEQVNTSVQLVLQKRFDNKQVKHLQATNNDCIQPHPKEQLNVITAIDVSIACI